MQVKKENEVIIIGFIKAVSNEFFDSFKNDGDLSFNTSQFFRDTARYDNNIGDLLDGVAPIPEATVELGNVLSSPQEKKLNDESKIDTEVVSFDTKDLKVITNVNTLSLYALTFMKNDEDEYIHLVPKKYIDAFTGCQFVIIQDSKEFVNRISKELHRNKIKALGSMITYNLPTYIENEEVIPFYKEEKYSYQNEYRIAFNLEKPERKTITIGSLVNTVEKIDLYKNPYIFNFGNIKITVKLDLNS